MGVTIRPFSATDSKAVNAPALAALRQSDRFGVPYGVYLMDPLRGPDS